MMGGCLRRVVSLVVVGVVLALLWINRARVVDVWQDLAGGGEPAPVSPELAAQAERKLATLDDGPSPGRVALGTQEVQSLVQYRMTDALPAYLLEPRVELGEGRIRVHARVPRESMPDIPGAGEVAGLLPDTTDVAAQAQVLPLSGGRVAIAVHEISAAKIPLPGRMIPSLLRRIGRRDEPGLPADAIAVRLPTGACTAYVHQDSLVLTGAGEGAVCP